jgi:hypothetical protein
MLSEVVEFASFVFWSVTDHVCAYVFDPHTFLLNFVIACLMYALHVDGAVKGRQLVAMATAEELMVYALWLTVSHGLRSVFAIWVCLSIYDGIVRPTIQLQSNPFFVAGEHAHLPVSVDITSCIWPTDRQFYCACVCFTIDCSIFG